MYITKPPPLMYPRAVAIRLTGVEGEASWSAFSAGEKNSRGFTAERV
jgi:hypothetical protein